jgi:16S rRNA (cytosine1402-N4)-methyltransferase
VASYDETALADVFKRHGEQPHARRIARAIVAERARAPIETPARLADIVASAVPRDTRRRRIHPATRVFQALRIEVNRELETLPAALGSCLDLLRPDGRLCVISYHSLEDRIVKRFIARERRGCTCPPEVPVCVCGKTPRLATVGPQPQLPSTEEVAHNPRARSARLRAARRLAA